MKIFKIEELAQIQQGQNYKYMGLFDQAGTCIIPFNPNKIPIARRLQEIETKLISPGLKDGYYIVQAKSTTAKNVVPDHYTVYKGEQLGEKAPAITPAVQIVEKHITPDVLSYEQALKMQVELASLKLENAALKKEIEELKADLSDAETLSEEEKSSVWAGAKDFLSELVQMGAPLLDKHFELKEKALTLEALKLQRIGGTNKPAPKFGTKSEDQRKIENWIITKKEDPECYEDLARIYNSAANIEGFLKSLNEYNEELFNELTATK